MTIGGFLLLLISKYQSTPYTGKMDLDNNFDSIYHKNKRKAKML